MRRGSSHCTDSATCVFRWTIPPMDSLGFGSVHFFFCRDAIQGLRSISYPSWQRLAWHFLSVAMFAGVCHIPHLPKTYGNCW